jgi:HEAT repeat protein
MNALLFALAVAVAADDAEALEKFKNDLKGKDGAGRAAAIEELAKTKSPKICTRLATLLTNEVVEVRAAAAKALGTQEDKKRALAFLLAAVPPASKEPVVLSAIVSALGKLGEEAGVAEVNKQLFNEHLDVARAAVEAAGEIRSTSSFDPLIKAMKECEEILKPRDRNAPGGGFGGGFGTRGGPGGMQNFREMRDRAQTLKPEIQKVLVAMAKVNCQDAQDWELWWKENRAKYKPEKP